MTQKSIEWLVQSKVIKISFKSRGKTKKISFYFSCIEWFLIEANRFLRQSFMKQKLIFGKYEDKYKILLAFLLIQP